MTLVQFSKLSRVEQHIALKEAVLLTDRIEGNYIVYLFALGGFYVEMFCHQQLPALNSHRAVESTDYLDKFIENIEIPRFS